MATRKILTDSGLYYAFYTTSASRFESPALENLDRYVEYVAAARLDYSAEDKIKNDAKEATVVFDLRSQTIDQNLRFVSRLLLGDSLSEDEGEQLALFAQFMEEAYSDLRVESVLQGRLGKWISEYELSDPEGEEGDILALATALAYQNARNKRRFPQSACILPVGPVTPNHNKLAGRYLSMLCLFLGILTPNSVNAVQLIERFRHKR